MLVHLCDGCHKQIGHARFALNSFVVLIKDEERYRIDDREFCSRYCMQQYIINGLRNRGLEEHTKP